MLDHITQEIEIMDEYAIELVGEKRDDGSVCVRSKDLPAFCVVGDSDRNALDIALELLPTYLKANVPEFVDLRPIPSVKELTKPEGASLLPAHVIARTGKVVRNAAQNSERSC
jgi:hypothetical protein